MRNLGLLLKGEVQRLLKYNIVQVGFGVTMLWVLVMFLLGREEAGFFVPLFVFMDAALMSVLLMGAGLIYEKQENTVKSMLVAPVGLPHVIASKLISAVYVALQSALFIGLVAFFFFDVTVRFHILLPVVALVALVHAAIGFALTLVTDDFTSFIALLAVYMIVFTFPSIFYALDLTGEILEMLLIISPAHASMLWIETAFDEAARTVLLVLGSVYLLILSAALIWFVGRKYPESAIRE